MERAILARADGAQVKRAKTLEQRAIVAQRRIADRHRIYAPPSGETPTVIRKGWLAGYSAGRRDARKPTRICPHGVAGRSNCAVCAGLRGEQEEIFEPVDGFDSENDRCDYVLAYVNAAFAKAGL